MKIMVIRQNSVTLREIWGFYFNIKWDDGKFVLDFYKKEVRKSTHHAAKWHAGFNSYDRILSRYGLKLENVPLPEDVKQEAKRLLLEEINKIPVTV